MDLSLEKREITVMFSLQLICNYKWLANPPPMGHMQTEKLDIPQQEVEYHSDGEFHGLDRCFA